MLWVEVRETLARVVDCEAPLDRDSVLVAPCLPSSGLTGESVSVRNSVSQALAGEDAELNLRHVEPTGVFGRVVKLQPAQEPPGFSGREGFVEAGRLVRVQVVHNEANTFRFWVAYVDQLLHLSGEVELGPRSVTVT
jgi:hypothetical protein